MRIEVIGLLTCGLILYFDKIRGKHRVPLTINIPSEDRTFVAPLGEILDGGRPHTDITTAIGGIVGIVRTDDVGTQFTGIIGILKHTGLTVRHMLPQREIRILCADTQCRTH